MTVEGFMEQVHAATKWALSFTKAEWTLEDYPIRIRDAHRGNPHGPERVPDNSRWQAQMINWWGMCGIADTREAALEMLRKNLETHRGKRPLPRPGSRVPIEFASTDKIDARAEVLDDFAQRVLGLESGNYWISDESSLWDFAMEDGLDQIHAKIIAVYNVDVSDVDDARIWKILDRIPFKGR